MIPFKVTIRENQVDILGHLNNAVYLELFEVARWDVIHGKGYSLKKILDLKQGPVILELNLKFTKEVLAREEITILSELAEYKGKVGVIVQKMFKSNGDQAAELKVVLGLFDMKTRRLIDPTPEWLAALS